MRKTGAVPAIVCAAVLMVNLAGCAAGNTGPDKSAEPSSPEAAVENEASAEEKEAETAPSEEPDKDSSEPSVFTEDEEAVYEQAITGDGIVNTDAEDCDGDSFFLDVYDCEEYSHSYIGGKLKCDRNCKYDLSACISAADSRCGDGILYGDEECDGDKFFLNISNET